MSSTYSKSLRPIARPSLSLLHNNPYQTAKHVTNSPFRDALLPKLELSPQSPAFRGAKLQNKFMITYNSTYTYSSYSRSYTISCTAPVVTYLGMQQTLHTCKLQNKFTQTYIIRQYDTRHSLDNMSTHTRCIAQHYGRVSIDTNVLKVRCMLQWTFSGGGGGEQTLVFLSEGLRKKMDEP